MTTESKTCGKFFVDFCNALNQSVQLDQQIGDLRDQKKDTYKLQESYYTIPGRDAKSACRRKINEINEKVQKLVDDRLIQTNHANNSFRELTDCIDKYPFFKIEEIPRWKHWLDLMKIWGSNK